MISGFLHPGYADSLREFGLPLSLPRAGGAILVRELPPDTDCTGRDAVSCYPCLACRSWTELGTDLDELGEQLVCLAVAPDPFGDYTIEDLHVWFPDHVVHVKDHYVADLRATPAEIVSGHHRRYARRALREVDVEFVEQPQRLLDLWLELFQHTVHRFRISGVHAFSRQAFEEQFRLPGSVMSLAWWRGKAVAAHLWMCHGSTAYFHLTGAQPSARTIGADFALYYQAIAYFRERVRQIDWGGEAGLGREGSLSSFKQGWSTTSRPAFFCGRIYDRDAYARLCAARGTALTGYFPAYRTPPDQATADS
jgi:hypothetical protein